ncbi:MAG: histidine phosphatase family protein [Candidatus Rokubacteria bacterium]|nr:histidine phosphatase family protein [Candidatus Rokubacteria bacterium]
MELWLVRHGETTWNEARRFQGGRDAALSPRGHAEARALAAALAEERFDALLLVLNDTRHLDDGGTPGSPP